MSRFGILCGRLLERRLLGDGEAHASLIPGAFLTLALSILVFSLVLPERTTHDVALYLAIACLVWSGVKAFLEADDLEAAELDRAVLEPLPIAPSMLAAARAVVVAAGLLLSTLNLALPVAVMVGVIRGAPAGLLLLAAAGLASLAGLAFALASRVVMQRVFGGRGMAQLEGPIRLVVAVGLFAVVFVAPDFTALLRRFPALASAPPFSFASLAAGESYLAAVAAGAVSLAVMLATFLLGPSGRDRASRSGRPASERLGFTSRWLVRDDECGGFEFASANVARDRTFRSRSYPLFAFPFAVTILVVQRPEEPTLALLALYGTAVYLSVAQLLFPYTESPGGAALFRTLPLRDMAPFRTGAEKAFLLGVGLPVYLALSVALVVLSLFGYGFPPATAIAHAVLGALAGATVTSFLFHRIPEPAFSCADEGAYARDTNGPMVAILLAALLGVVAFWAAGSVVRFVVVAAAFLVVMKGMFAWKRRSTTDGA